MKIPAVKKAMGALDSNTQIVVNSANTMEDAKVVAERVLKEEHAAACDKVADVSEQV